MTDPILINWYHDSDPWEYTGGAVPYEVASKLKDAEAESPHA
jgi:hypothetical protein